MTQVCPAGEAGKEIPATTWLKVWYPPMAVVRVTPQTLVEVDQSGSMRGSRRVPSEAASGSLEQEPGNQPIWGESPLRRVAHVLLEEAV